MDAEKLPQTIRELIDSIDVYLMETIGDTARFKERERYSRLRWALHDVLKDYENEQ